MKGLKVHMGCGSVYLRDWLNVDMPQPLTYLAVDRPDLVERWGTQESDYYGRHKDKTLETLRHGPIAQEYVCDRYGSFAFLPWPGFADEVLARHSFEHLSITEARSALDLLRSKMQPWGVLRLDVPDHAETLRLYAESRDVFYERHLFGPRRGDYGFHAMSYTRDRLITLVKEHGFRFSGEEPNIHIYPAFCLRFKVTL